MRERSIFTLHVQYVKHSLDLEVSYLWWVLCPAPMALLLGQIPTEQARHGAGHAEERLLRGCCSSAFSGWRRMMRKRSRW